MMMRGIVSKVLVNPITAAESYQKRIEELGADDVMMVHWTNDGVEFDDHHEHPLTLDLIKEALNVLNHIEEIQTEEDSEDWEWI